MKYLRAAWRAGATLAMSSALIPAQLILGPLTGDHTTIPQIMQRGLRRIFNVDVDVKGQVDDAKQDIILANHLSWLDAPVLGSLFSGAFVGKNDIASWPLIGYIAKCFRTIFIERTKEYLPEARSKLAAALNEGQSVIIFPESKTSDGSDVLMFKAGLLKILYNDAVDMKGNPIVVTNPVCIQPVALRVLETDGQDATDNQAARDRFCWHGEQPFLTHLWGALTAEGMKVEVTVLPPLHPKDFANHFDLANTAHKMVREVVIGQRLPDPEPYTPH